MESPLGWKWVAERKTLAYYINGLIFYHKCPRSFFVDIINSLLEQAGRIVSAKIRQGYKSLTATNPPAYYLSELLTTTKRLHYIISNLKIFQRKDLFHFLSIHINKFLGRNIIRTKFLVTNVPRTNVTSIKFIWTNFRRWNVIRTKVLLPFPPSLGIWSSISNLTILLQKD